MEQIILKYKEQKWTLPKENLVNFAQFQALNWNKMDIFIKDEKSAINFFESLGFIVELA